MQLSLIHVSTQESEMKEYIFSMSDLENDAEEMERVCACLWLSIHHRSLDALKMDSDTTVILHDKTTPVSTEYIHLYPGYLVKRERIQKCEVQRNGKVVGCFQMPLFDVHSLRQSPRQQALIEDITFLYCHPSIVDHHITHTLKEVQYLSMLNSHVSIVR